MWQRAPPKHRFKHSQQSRRLQGKGARRDRVGMLLRGRLLLLPGAWDGKANKVRSVLQVLPFSALQRAERPLAPVQASIREAGHPQAVMAPMVPVPPKKPA